MLTKQKNPVASQSRGLLLKIVSNNDLYVVSSCFLLYMSLFITLFWQVESLCHFSHLLLAHALWLISHALGININLCTL